MLFCEHVTAVLDRTGVASLIKSGATLSSKKDYVKFLPCNIVPNAANLYFINQFMACTNVYISYTSSQKKTSWYEKPTNMQFSKYLISMSINFLGTFINI
jgi:hypothetical protein